MSFTTYLQRAFRSRKNSRPPHRVRKPRPRPELEHLEERLAPVLGALAIPAPVAPGTGFDGVVDLSGCTGALLSSGRHILTAAHCITDGSGAINVASVPVTFDLMGKSITMNVPQANYWIHPNWNGNTSAGYDVAILRLPSLAPSGPVGMGAERYPIQQVADEIGQTFRVVGYGNRGTGSTGMVVDSGGTKRSAQNVWTANANVLRNEVQRVSLTGLATGGTFVLHYSGQYTGAIPFNATAAQVQAALVALPLIGAADVNVEGGPALGLAWYVSFRGALANTNVPLMGGSAAGLMGLNPGVAVATLFQGAANAPAVGALTYDFDNGQARNDALGLFHGLGGLGLGANEGIQSRGDSGGPAFLENRVSGIVSYSRFGPDGLPDFDGEANNSFGEMAVMTRVSSFAGSINSQINGSHALILDMNFQHAGNNGVADTIEALRFGAYLLLRVNGQIVHSDLLTDITSLTIRGSNDRDIITVAGDLDETVVVQGGSGIDDLIVTGTSGADTATITSIEVELGGTTVQYSAVQHVRVETEGGNDVIRVRSTAGGAPVTVLAGIGNDTIIVGRPDNPFSAFHTLDDLAASVTVNGESGSDTLSVRDNWVAGFGYTYGISSTTVSRSAAQVIYSSIQELELVTRTQDDTINVTGTSSGTATTVHAQSGNDTINVRATGAGGPLTVNAGDGNDTISLGSAANTLNTIQGVVVVNGEAGTNSLTLNDQGNALGQTYLVVPNAVVRAPAVVVGYAGIQTVQLNASAGEDLAWVQGTSAGTAVGVNGGGGIDTLVGPDQGATWSLTAANAGAVAGPLLAMPASFSSFGNLVGYLGTDTYAFGNGVALTGFVYDLGGANNRLDYSAYATDVYVNLVLLQATGTSFVYGIQNVTGGAGNDILVGDHVANALDGGPGRDLLIAGGWDYALGALSHARDSLRGGSGDDILIAGFTAHDLNPAALAAIRDAWAQPASYASRVSDLITGAGGVPALNAGTVFYNHAAGGNTLSGNADLDFFFGQEVLDIDDRDPLLERFVELI